jgi:rRNA maturation protein Nop10
MTLRAIAFHESISTKKLEEIFSTDANTLFGGTLGARCPTCGLRFAVFFPAYDDPKNQDYLTELQKLIASDCKQGKHCGEYAFKTSP